MNLFRTASICGFVAFRPATLGHARSSHQFLGGAAAWRWSATRRTVARP
jgi:hypothetical protein